MKAIEFESELADGGLIALPADVAERLCDAGRFRVIVLVPEDDLDAEAAEAEDDADWRRAAAEQFFRDDGPDDHLYDDYDRHLCDSATST